MSRFAPDTAEESRTQETQGGTFLYQRFRGQEARQQRFTVPGGSLAFVDGLGFPLPQGHVITDAEGWELFRVSPFQITCPASGLSADGCGARLFVTLRLALDAHDEECRERFLDRFPGRVLITISRAHRLVAQELRADLEAYLRARRAEDLHACDDPRALCVFLTDAGRRLRGGTGLRLDSVPRARSMIPVRARAPRSAGGATPKRDALPPTPPSASVPALPAPLIDGNADGDLFIRDRGSAVERIEDSPSLSVLGFSRRTLFHRRGADDPEAALILAVDFSAFGLGSIRSLALDRRFSTPRLFVGMRRGVIVGALDGRDFTAHRLPSGRNTRRGVNGMLPLGAALYLTHGDEGLWCLALDEPSPQFREVLGEHTAHARSLRALTSYGDRLAIAVDRRVLVFFPRAPEQSLEIFDLGAEVAALAAAGSRLFAGLRRDADGSGGVLLGWTSPPAVSPATLYESEHGVRDLAVLRDGGDAWCLLVEGTARVLALNPDRSETRVLTSPFPLRRVQVCESAFVAGSKDSAMPGNRAGGSPCGDFAPLVTALSLDGARLMVWRWGDDPAPLCVLNLDRPTREFAVFPASP